MYVLSPIKYHAVMHNKTINGDYIVHLTVLHHNLMKSRWEIRGKSREKISTEMRPCYFVSVSIFNSAGRVPVNQYV